MTTVIDRHVARIPIVVQARHHRKAAALGVKPERCDDAPVPVWLLPHRIAIRQPDGTRIVETAHAVQRAEVVIERAIFLHQDHHVLDVVDRPCAVIRSCGQRLGEGRSKSSPAAAVATKPRRMDRRDGFGTLIPQYSFRLEKSLRRPIQARPAEA